MSGIPDGLVAEAEEIGRAALAELVDDGLDAEEALGLLAALADAALPLRVLVPAPWGYLAEGADGPALRVILRALLPLLRRDPARIESRADRAAERGHFLVAARRRARAARLLGGWGKA